MFCSDRNSCLNCFKVERIQDYKKNDSFIYFLDRKIHKEVRRLEDLLVADALSTGLGRCGRRRKLRLDGAVDL